MSRDEKYQQVVGENASTVVLDPKAVSVIFDFGEPFWARRNLSPDYRDAELKRFRMRPR
jgi:hypothetical protein